jgi:hypothetical protein
MSERPEAKTAFVCDPGTLSEVKPCRRTPEQIDCV